MDRQNEYVYNVVRLNKETGDNVNINVDIEGSTFDKEVAQEIFTHAKDKLVKELMEVDNFNKEEFNSYFENGVDDDNLFTVYNECEGYEIEIRKTALSYI